MGSIMIHYILEAHQQAGTLPQNASVLKSIVSSELATAIAEKYNTKMFNVLTGFKFIAEKFNNTKTTVKRLCLVLKKVMVT